MAGPNINPDSGLVNQPNVVNTPENNWPDPLVDPSSKLKIAVTNGSNGSQSNRDIVSTSQQDRGEHHLTEGQGAIKTGDMEAQGGHGNKLKTSQQNAGGHHTAESN